MRILPVMKDQCRTCPFRENGWADVRPLLEERVVALQGTPICHSTGKALTKRIHKEEHACRGARDLQTIILYRIGFLSAPTDATWNERVEEMLKRESHKKKRKTKREVQF